MRKLSTVEIVNNFIKNHNIEDEDLQQALFLAAFELKEINPDSSSTSIGSRLSCVAKKYLENAKNKQDNEYLDFTYYLDELVDKDLLKEIIPKILEEKCTERELLVVHLRCYNEMTYTDIAKIIGLSIESARRIYFGALRKFRDPKVSRLIIDFYE